MSAVQGGSSTPGLANVTNKFGLVTTITPWGGNHFSAGILTTSLAFTNGVNVIDIRNPSAQLMVIPSFWFRITTMAIAAPALTGLNQGLSAVIRRNYTVVSPTNRTALTLTTNNCKMCTGQSTSSAEIGFSSNVAGITGGTATDDATPICSASGAPQTHAVTAAAAPGAGVQHKDGWALQFQTGPYESPIILAQNEGIRINIAVTTAAACIVSGNLRWFEIDSAQFAPV